MEEDFANEGMKLIPSDAIRSSGLSFNFLLFSQIERINKTRQWILLKPNVLRKETALTFYFLLDDLETLLWGKLEKNQNYLEDKEELNVETDATFKLLGTSDLASILLFCNKLSKWYKLLSKNLRAFGFYPATQMDFVSGVGEYSQKPIPKTRITK